MEGFTSRAWVDPLKDPDPGPVRLHASCLFARWGFRDGEILDDHFEAWGIETHVDVPHGPYAGRFLKTAALQELVKRHLLPRAPHGFATSELEATTHNPIRADTTDDGEWIGKTETWPGDVVVEASAEQVLEAIYAAWGSRDLPREGQR